MEDFRPGSLDDWDWSSTAPAEGDVTSAVPPREPEPLPPPEPAPRRRGSDYSEFVEENRPGTDRLTGAYAEGAKNIYKRRAPEPEWNPGSIDDYDWGESSPAVSGKPAYDPKDDWALTRGFKVAADQGTQSITAVGDMTRILGLKTTEEQVAEMLKIGRTTDDPSAPKLAIQGFTDIDSFGEGMSYIGESFGQMVGSLWAAATTGGATGAATGAAVGAGAGALGFGAGAIPGAFAGGAYGFTRGTLTSFLGMGVGGTFRELLQDKGVQEGLENGSVKVDDVYRWAIAGGGVIGLLDAVPIANRWTELTGGKELATEVFKSSIKKAALKGLAKGALEEGGTEAVQGAISELGQAVVGGNVNLAERSIHVIDQFLAGGIGGGPFGVLGGIRENARLPDDPGRSTPAYPAGTSGPRSQPGGFAPGVGPGGGPGTGGPGTGYSTKPPPPVDAGVDPSDTRDYGKGTAPGARVTATPVDETDADIAAALGFEEETPTGESPRPKVVPTGKRKRPAAPVDPDISATLTSEEAAPVAGAEAGTAPPVVETPAAPAAPRAPRGRRPAPQVETITEEMPQVEPAAEEGGVRPWQEEFGPDPHEALRRMPETDPRYPEVVAWANAKDQATLDQFPEEPAAAEAAPAAEPAPAAPQQPAGVAFVMTRQMRQDLADLGYPRDAVKQMTPQQAHDLITAGTRYAAPEVVAEPEPVQRESIVEEEVIEAPVEPEITPELRAEMEAIQRAEDAVSPWPKRQKKAKPVEEEIEEAPEPEEKPYRGLRKLKAFAEALKPTKHKLEGATVKGRWVGRYERLLKLQELGQVAQKTTEPTKLSKARKRAEKLPITEVERYDATAINSAKDKLNSLVRKPSQYQYLWRHLAPELQEALGPAFQPEAKLAKPTPAPQKVAAKREEPEARPEQPVKKKGAPRAAIELGEAPTEEAPKPKAETVTRTVRLTPTMLAGFRGTREAALQRLKGAVLRHKKALKKAGTITGVTFEGETVTAEKEPAPELTVAGKTYTSTEAFNAARKKARSEKLRREFSDAYSSRDYSALLRWEQTEPETRTEQFPEGRLIISVGGKTQQMTSEALLDKYAVDITTTEERLEPVRLAPKTTAARRLAKHFRYGTKEPVKLSSVGMTDAQITQLEAGGFAEDGSMDLAEFQRWRKTLTGPQLLSTEFRERTFEERREVREAKPTYQPHGAVPETERVTTAGEKAAEAVRVAMRRAQAKAEAEAEAEEAEQKETGKKKRLPPAEKAQLAVARRLLEPTPSGKVKEVKVEPVTKPSAEFGKGVLGLSRKQREARAEPVQQFETLPIMTPPAVGEELAKAMGKSPEALAEQMAKEALTFVEGTKTQKSMADAISKAFDRAMREAEKLTEKLQSAAEKAAIEAAQKIAQAREELKGTEYQSVERTGKLKGKRAEAIRNEDPKRTYINARAAYYVNGTNDTAGIKPKPDDELAALLWEMGRLKHEVSEAHKEGPKANREHIRGLNAMFNFRNDQRIALAEKFDAIEAGRAKYWNEEAAKQLVKYHNWLSKLVKEDKLTADQAYDIRSSFISRERMVKRKRRTMITDPVIKRVLREMPPPAELTAEEVKEVDRHIKAGTLPKGWPSRMRERYSASTVLNMRIRTWLEGFIKAIDKGVREANREIRNPKARAVLPHRANRFNNSAEENMVQFVRGRLGRIEDAEAQNQDNYYQLGQSMSDAWWAASLFHPEAVRYGVPSLLQSKPKTKWRAGKKVKTKETIEWEKVSKRRPNISEHEHYLDMINRERELYDMMFDASGTGSTVRSARELEWVADYALAQEERAEMMGTTVEAMPAVEVGHRFKAETVQRAVRESTAQTEIARQMRILFGEDPDVLESPRNMEGIEARHGGPTQTMTGAEAIDRHTSTTKGSFRSKISAALKTLVGDVPVHFISADAMQEMRGRAAPGFYDRTSHTIYMHEALRDHPDMLADTIIHEMTHAATAYAIKHNIRGAKDILSRIMKAVDAEIVGDMRAYMKNPEEFIAGTMESSRFQKALRSMGVPLRDRAALRALAKGRPLANMWDYMMAFMENAVGVFTPAGFRRSYFDEIVRLFPDIAMSSQERRADEALRERRAPETTDENYILEHPFSVDGVKGVYDRLAKGTRSFKGRQFFNLHIAPMEYLKRDIAEKYMAGEFNNPISRFIDTAFLKHTRSVEDEMRAGLEIDNRLRRWFSVDPMTRRDIARDAIVGVAEASFDKIDVRLTLAENKHIWDDAAHPLKSGKPRKEPTARHEKATFPRAAYDRHRAMWDAIPEDLQAILSDRMDHMKEALRGHDHDLIDMDLEMLETKEVDAITLPPGMTRAEAAEQIYAGAVSPELKAALGKNLKTLENVAGRLAESGGMYWPASRAGPWYISGRRKIATPKAERGEVEVDKEALKEKNGDRHFFVFTNIRDAGDYMKEMGETGAERIIGRQVRYINPITGEHVFSDDGGRIDGVDWEPEPRYYVEVQHRFMAMGETVKELEELREAELNGPDAKEYDWIAEPIAMSVNHTPDKAMVPSQLAAFHHNIDSMKGKTKAEKAQMKSMATNVFIRTQQGNRLTKRMLRRAGVAGYETKLLDNLMATLNANNEMMSRHRVNRRRMAAIEKARKDAQNFIYAAAGRGGVGDPEALAKVEPHLRHLLTRDYGKEGRAAQLSQDWETIQKRYEQLLNPREIRFLPERWGNAVQSILVQTYLATPMYNIVNAMGFWLQSFPRMAGELGFSAALRYSNKADAYMSGMGNKWAGFSEALLEGKDFATGFLPRAGYKYPRGFREQRNIFEESMTKMQAAHPDDWHVPHMVAAAEEARLRNHVGQAGLDQINLNTDLMEPGGMQKVFRGIESSQRVFRAVQEGVELDTRLKPMFARLLYYLDSGMDPEQAKQKAINEMVNDQTGYSKENWPAWMNLPIIRRIVMFKKFPIQQTLNFYRAMRGTARGDMVAASQLFYMSAALTMLGGAYGLPPWELVRLLMYLFNKMGFPVPENWNVAKSKMEAAVGDVIGERAAESLAYGLPRLIGIDLSSRLALDGTLFFQQPKELTNDGIMAALGYAVGGAPVSTGINMLTAFQPLIEEGNIPKFISQAPVPRYIKDIAKAYDTYVNGPTTKTGLHTGEAPGILSTILASAGLRTREQARPFEQG
ncbi:MAG: hypothetical protein ABWY64_04070, partial [Tardiphaga sp.]